MADGADKQEWVKRVLGIDVFGAAEPGANVAARSMPPLLPIWNEAKDRVDAGLEKLQAAMRNDEDEDVRFIGQYGLLGIGGVQNVALIAALMEADKSGTPSARAKVQKAVAAYGGFLNNPVIELVESNGLGVSVPLRAILGPALAAIAQHAAS